MIQLSRSAVLSAALLVGVCIGVMASEKLYLLTQEADLPQGAVAAVRSSKLEVGGGGGGSALTGFSSSVGVNTLRRAKGGKPRSELEAILQKVAPQGEVMIAISNINLIHEHSLKMWLEVRRGAGVA